MCGKGLVQVGDNPASNAYIKGKMKELCRSAVGKRDFIEKDMINTAVTFGCRN